MPAHLLDEAEFKKLLRHTRLEPVNFAFGLGKMPDEHVLVFHRKKDGESLFKALRRETDGITKGTWGVAESDNESLILRTAKPLVGLEQSLRLYLKFKGIKLKPVIHEAAPAGKDASTGGPDDVDERSQLVDRLKKLTARCQAAIKADPARAGELKKMLLESKAQLDRDALDDVRASIIELGKRL